MSEYKVMTCIIQNLIIISIFIQTVIGCGIVVSFYFLRVLWVMSGLWIVMHLQTANIHLKMAKYEHQTRNLYKIIDLQPNKKAQIFIIITKYVFAKAIRRFDIFTLLIKT